jgi:ubiquitin C-terminal hydrolase
MIGFKNMGNTCYLNSGLQMIIQNKDLCEIISNNSYGSEILTKISDFIKQYYNSSNAIIPSEIKKIVEKKQALFGGFDQQDSTEFIIFFLDIIDEEIKKVDTSSNGIQSLFGIDFNVRIKCKLMSCLQVYNKKETNNFLILDMNSKYTSLEEIYRNYKSGTKLDEDNKYFCKKCQDKRIASNRHTIDKWPNNLFIWLKRFKQEGKRITKNDQKIEVPFDWIHENKLQGAIIHYGNLNGGHYIYVGKQNNKWYVFNDSSVNEIESELEVKSLLSNAYWLYYKKN